MQRGPGARSVGGWRLPDHRPRRRPRRPDRAAAAAACRARRHAPCCCWRRWPWRCAALLRQASSSPAQRCATAAASIVSTGAAKAARRCPPRPQLTRREVDVDEEHAACGVCAGRCARQRPGGQGRFRRSQAAAACSASVERNARMPGVAPPSAPLTRVGRVRRSHDGRLPVEEVVAHGAGAAGGRAGKRLV